MYHVTIRSKIDKTNFKMQSNDIDEIMFYISAMSTIYDLQHFKTEIYKTNSDGVPVDFYNVTIITPLRATP